MWSRIWKMPTEVSPDGGNIVNHTIEMKLMLFFFTYCRSVALCGVHRPGRDIYVGGQ